MLRVVDPRADHDKGSVDLTDFCRRLRPSAQIIASRSRAGSWTMATPQRAHGSAHTHSVEAARSGSILLASRTPGLAIWNAMLWVRNGVCRPD